MLPILALHTLAQRRGDGLRPELLALLTRRIEIGLSAPMESDDSPPLRSAEFHSEEVNCADDRSSHEKVASREA